MALQADGRNALLVAAARLAVSLGVLASGFQAVSDDDYARIVIAQSFAHAPSLDPSGTSWLPLPFWVTGGAMMAFGSTLAVARVVAVLLGVLAALAVYVAGRWLDLPPGRALAAALLACAIPYSAVFGVAAVPDGPTAALIVLGMTGATSPVTSRRTLAGVALGAACLSRYEAWPVAAGFALLAAWDAARARRAAPLLAAVIASAPALAWMAHGALAHGDAFFFVKRVAAYREALGLPAPSLIARLCAAPLSVLRSEPEITSAAVIVALLARRELARYRRVALLAALLIGFLVIGDVRGSAPTHHVERAVLSVWLVAAIVLADLAPMLLAGRSSRVVAGALAAAVTLGSLVVRPWFARRDAFADRSRELAAGTHARTFVLAPARLLS
ncbi:MAG: glycosyltransferase family 39 protein, partial [Sorangiineae bacterium]|nr:glycosyltransferase family 39 protein [Sorangiineae bacterium]